MWRDATIFACGTLILIALTLQPAWEEYRRNEQSIVLLKLFQASLAVESAIVGERGLSNAVMNMGLGINDPLPPVLRDLQENTNQAFDNLEKLLEQSDIPSLYAQRELTNERKQLARARTMVREAAAQPGALRPEERVREAIANMIYSIEIIEEITIDISLEATKNDRSVATSISMSRRVNVLRDLSGRIGAVIVPVLTNKRQFSDEEIVYIDRLYGGLRRIIVVLKQRDADFGEDRKTREILTDTMSKYIKLLMYFDRILKESRRKNLSLTTDEFYPIILPVLKSAEALRDRFVEISVEEATSLRDKARNRMVIAFFIGFAMLLLPLLLAISALRHLFLPLRSARQQILAIVSDDDGTPIRQREGDVADDLLSVVGVLKESERRRSQVDAEREALNLQFKAMAEADSLTGCLNRRGLESVLEKIKHSIVAEDKLIIVMIIDLDLFKNINDTYGHSKGDEVLREVAKRIGHSSRKEDFVVRFGGEEFLLLLVKDEAEPGRIEEDAFSAAEHVRHAICDLPIKGTEGGVLSVSASVGVAIGGAGACDFSTLFEAADEALYQAKQGGRNRTVVARKGNRTDAKTRRVRASDPYPPGAREENREEAERQSSYPVLAPGENP